MFTGIVAATGNLQSRELRGGDVRMRFRTPAQLLQGCVNGESICVAGVCLTMLEPDESGFSADLSVETLDKTSLGKRKLGEPVNLELALRVADRLGGHLVSGHVDGLAELLARRPDARAERLKFKVDPRLQRYVAQKGSVCLDGVSLTVNEVDDNRFSVCVIPHTLAVTTLGSLSVGDRVNIEIDLIARYLERLNQCAGEQSPVSS